MSKKVGQWISLMVGMWKAAAFRYQEPCPSFHANFFYLGVLHILGQVLMQDIVKYT